MSDMELGNMLFGNSRGEVGIPREAAWELPFRICLQGSAWKITNASLNVVRHM